MTEPSDPKRPTCATCPAFEPDANGRIGTCRRQSLPPGGVYRPMLWSTVGVHDWCMEHPELAGRMIPLCIEERESVTATDAQTGERMSLAELINRETSREPTIPLAPDGESLYQADNP